MIKLNNGMNSISVIEVEDKEWSAIVRKSIDFDFYHTRCYHLLEKENRPVLCVARFNEDFIAIPLIIRPILNTSYFDCTSAYGYCGPISNLALDSIPTAYMLSFQQGLIGFFKENNIVSAFSRLHPLIPFGSLFDNFGTVKDINKTVAIDLSLSVDEQRRQFRKSNKSELNQLRRKGYEVVEASATKDIDAFIAIYHETMDRVEARDNYFFDKEYFYKFLNNDCFDNKLLLAKKEGEIVAGAIFTVTNKIMQYHLAGTTAAYMKETPMKLILDEARLKANELQLEFLHLGGGVGGSDEDSLFRFKSGFSNYRCYFKTWQYIADEDQYRILVQNSDVDSQTTYFPAYRSK